jgi:thymidine kinase
MFKQLNSKYHVDGGSCRLIFGPMFSGKSTTLRDEITTLADIGLKVIYINHTKDVRDTEAQDRNITTHHSGFRGLSEKVSVIKIDQLSKVNVEDYNVIGVDEGQFFDDLDVVVRKWVLKEAKIVIIASLDGDFMMRPFGKAHKLVCICEPWNVVKLSAMCVKCIEYSLEHGRIVRNSAGFTAKFKIDPEIIEGKDYTQDDVGGKDKYLPVCMKCYQEHMTSIKEQIIIPCIDLDKIQQNNSNISAIPLSQNSGC